MVSGQMDSIHAECPGATLHGGGCSKATSLSSFILIQTTEREPVETVVLELLGNGVGRYSHVVAVGTCYYWVRDKDFDENTGFGLFVKESELIVWMHFNRMVGVRLFRFR
jgi:hypothetical protein